MSLKWRIPQIQLCLHLSQWAWNGGFHKYSYVYIYPSEPEMEDSTNTAMSTSIPVSLKWRIPQIQLCLHLSQWAWNGGFHKYSYIVHWLTHRIWQWRFVKKRGFNLPIVYFPFACSNIQAAAAYGVHISIGFPWWRDVIDKEASEPMVPKWLDWIITLKVWKQMIVLKIALNYNWYDEMLIFTVFFCFFS